MPDACWSGECPEGGSGGIGILEILVVVLVMAAAIRLVNKSDSWRISKALQPWLAGALLVGGLVLSGAIVARM